METTIVLWGIFCQLSLTLSLNPESLLARCAKLCREAGQGVGFQGFREPKNCQQ